MLYNGNKDFYIGIEYNNIGTNWEDKLNRIRMNCIINLYPDREAFVEHKAFMEIRSFYMHVNPFRKLDFITHTSKCIIDALFEKDMYEYIDSTLTHLNNNFITDGMNLTQLFKIQNYHIIVGMQANVDEFENTEENNIYDKEIIEYFNMVKESKIKNIAKKIRLHFESHTNGFKEERKYNIKNNLSKSGDSYRKSEELTNLIWNTSKLGDTIEEASVKDDTVIPISIFHHYHTYDSDKENDQIAILFNNRDKISYDKRELAQDPDYITNLMFRIKKDIRYKIEATDMFKMISIAQDIIDNDKKYKKDEHGVDVVFTYNTEKAEIEKFEIKSLTLSMDDNRDEHYNFIARISYIENDQLFIKYRSTDEGNYKKFSKPMDREHLNFLLGELYESVHATIVPTTKFINAIKKFESIFKQRFEEYPELESYSYDTDKKESEDNLYIKMTKNEFVIKF